MAKRSDEKIPVSYRVSGGIAWGLITFALIFDCISWLIALSGWIVTLATFAANLIPVVGQVLALVGTGTGWVIALMGSLLALVGNMIIIIAFWSLGVRALTRKISRLALKLISKAIPMLGAITVFVFPLTLMTWTTIKLSRAEDRFKAIKYAEQLFAVRSALSQKQLNANAWKRLTAAEQLALRKSGFNIDNIEQSAFGKELMEEAAKQKIGAKDLLPALRKAKTGAEVDAGLSKMGIKPDKPGADVGSGIIGPATGGLLAGFQKSENKITSVARYLGKTGEISLEVFSKYQKAINAQNRYNNFQQFYSGMPDEERKRFDAASPEEKRAMLEEYGLDPSKVDYSSGKSPDEVDGIRKMAEDELDDIDSKDLAKKALNADTTLSDEERGILEKYADELDDEDFLEAYREGEAEAAGIDGVGPAPLNVGGPLPQDGVTSTDEAFKVSMLKRIISGKQPAEIIRAESEHLRGSEQDYVRKFRSAENILRRRMLVIDRMSKKPPPVAEAAEALGIEPSYEVYSEPLDVNQLKSALRDRKLAASQMRYIAKAKSADFSEIIKDIGTAQINLAKQIRFGKFLEAMQGAEQKALRRAARNIYAGPSDIEIDVTDRLHVDEESPVVDVPGVDLHSIGLTDTEIDFIRKPMSEQSGKVFQGLYRGDRLTADQKRVLRDMRREQWKQVMDNVGIPESEKQRMRRELEAQGFFEGKSDSELS